MKRGWFGAPRGAHRVPEPGSLLAEADEARVRAAEPTAVIETVKVVPLAGTQAFDAAEMSDETGPAADAEPPPPVVTEPVFHRAISVSRAATTPNCPCSGRPSKPTGDSPGCTCEHHPSRDEGGYDQQLADDYDALKTQTIVRDRVPPSSARTTIRITAR